MTITAEPMAAARPAAAAPADAQPADADPAVDVDAWLRGLFVCSGIVDMVRDVAAAYLADTTAVSAVTVAQLAGQYEALRLRVAGLLDGDDLAVFALAAPSVPDGCPLDQLHAAASTFARCLDVFHEAPHFMAKNRVLAAVAVRAVRGLADEPVVSAAAGSGNYL
jgi:hypothetical protein